MDMGHGYDMTRSGAYVIFSKYKMQNFVETSTFELEIDLVLVKDNSRKIDWVGFVTYLEDWTYIGKKESS